MKLIDNTIYLEFAEMVECGVSENYLSKARSTGAKCWHFIDDPMDGRKVLIGFDRLKDQYKALVIEKFGEPALFLAQKPIKDQVKLDPEAERFYLNYRYNSTFALPLDHVKRYTLAASWLNFLVKLNEDKRKSTIIKKELCFPDLVAFYDCVRSIIRTNKIELPSSYSRLIQAMNAYKQDGYASLIDDRFGNQSAAKVKGEVSESFLLELIAHPNQYDDALVSTIYNRWALDNGYKPITSRAVNQWRVKRNHEVVVDRQGSETYNNELRRKVMRLRPSQPLFLMESDDNHLDWWFAGDKASDYRKIKGIIVTDSFNDYVLGWAITDAEMPGDLVRLAYINAMYHIRELTGGWYLPFEVKTDRWNLDQLRPFYEGVGKYYDTPVNSKNRGWLETFFGHADWERSLKIGRINYTGHNITAKTRGVNMEAVKLNKKQWPHISEASAQMAETVQRLRTVPRNYDDKNKSRQQEWLEAWNAMPEQDKKPITDEQFLLKFGFKHSFQNAITNQGIRPTIMGTQYAFSVPPALYMPNVGRKVDIIYDPYDMSRVLVTDNASLRFVARAMTPVAGCMADMNDGGRTFLNQILKEAHSDAVTYTQKRNRRQQIMDDNSIDTESVIKLAGAVPKEVKQRAELNYGREEMDDAPFNPFANS